ncbi:hypothetical protein C443_10742 [Haloarcula argentinensis DSM 12282]|nr:hypothetical protein C443_10742 [Haloarcula argentinensis DSM 12282]
MGVLVDLHTRFSFQQFRRDGLADIGGERLDVSEDGLAVFAEASALAVCSREPACSLVDDVNRLGSRVEVPGQCKATPCGCRASSLPSTGMRTWSYIAWSFAARSLHRWLLCQQCVPNQTLLLG